VLVLDPDPDELPRTRTSAMGRSTMGQKRKRARRS